MKNACIIRSLKQECMTLYEQTMNMCTKKTKNAYIIPESYMNDAFFKKTIVHE